jgi:alginate O-acetyltransferase complex protein AlgJ
VQEQQVERLVTATIDKGRVDAQALTGAGKTREEQALAELGQTFFSPGVAWTLTISFLLTLLLVPVVQAWSALQNARWHMVSAAGNSTPLVARAGFDPADVFKRVRQLVTLLPTAHQIRRFETTFQDRSVVGGFVRSRAQSLLTRWFNVGTDNVYIGQHKWLFYRDGVDYVTGPGFLSPHVLAQRRDMVDAVQQPDPRPAIFRFRDQLARRGIALVLLPTPDKVQLYPDRLEKRAARWTSIPQNPSFDQFKEELEGNGVHVFEPTAGFYRNRAQQLFLRADTHWMPAAVEILAHDFAQDLNVRVQWRQARSAYQVRPLDVIVPRFDLVTLLQLPPATPSSIRSPFASARFSIEAGTCGNRRRLRTC